MSKLQRIKEELAKLLIKYSVVKTDKAVLEYDGENLVAGMDVYVTNEEGEKVAKYAIKRFEKEFNVNIDDYNAINIVKDSKYPILLSAGSNEHMDEELNMLKDNNPLYSEVIILPGCNHGNGMYKQTKLYQDKIKEFIKKYVK